MDEANTVLHRFLPRFNEKFGIPAGQSSIAYRPLESTGRASTWLQWRVHIAPIWSVESTV